MNPEAMFELTDANGQKFFAAVVKVGEGYGVVSTRSGEWHRDDAIHVADLAFPEQALSDWTVKQVG